MGVTSRQPATRANGPERSDWPDGLVALYEQSYRDHVRLAYAMVGSRHEAEEIVQESVVEIGRRWDEIERPAPYLRRAVVNRAIGLLRRREVEQRHQVDPPPPHEPERLVELRDSLLGLPERQRAAIVLRFVTDLDDEAIAEILDCRRGTVRSLISRGLATLRSEVPR